MFLSNLYQWIFLIALFVLSLIVVNKALKWIDVNLKARTKNSFLKRLIKVLNLAVTIGVIALFVYPYFYLENNYLTRYVLITDNGKLEAEGMGLLGSKEFRWTTGKTTELTQQDNNKTVYINNTDNAVLFYPVAYGRKLQSERDFILSAQTQYVDTDNKLEIDYIVESMASIKENDEIGVKYYLMPLPTDY